MNYSSTTKLIVIVFFIILIIIKLSSFFFNAKFTVPPLTGRVVDAGNVFTKEERERIENAIIKLEEETGGQMVVTTLPSLKGQTIEDVGLRLGNEWKIGHKGKDNGAILIIVVPERQMRLEVGIGWEKPISNERAEYVIRHLTPFFRANKYADGSVWAVECVEQYVTGNKVEHSVKAPKRADVSYNKRNTKSNNGNSIIEIIVMLVLLVLCLFAKSNPNDNSTRNGSSSGGGFSGGGGSFRGGGASGRW